jgi:germination protein M
MKPFTYVILAVLVAMMMTGCGENSQNKQEGTYTLYQPSEDGDGLQTTSCQISADADDTVSIVTELLTKFPDTDVRDFEIKEKQLSLYFSSAYKKFEGIDEVLLRASIVKTLCQVEGIEYVEFFVEDTSLAIDGEAVGVMSSLSFMDSIGGDGYTQDKYVTLYFADTSGTGMKEISTKLTYDMTVPLAKLLVEKLLEGPGGLTDVNTSDFRQTIPEGTVLNSLTIRDNVCYVDFSREFENMQAEVTSEIVIYSIVNTLCELSDVNKVQFTIDGELKEAYGDTKNFNSPFERNLDLVSGGSKG